MNRLEKAIEKYGEVAEFSKEATQTNDGQFEQNTIKRIYKKGIPVKTIKDISKWDPSGNNKYLEWILSRKTDTSITYKTLKEFVSFFHNSPTKFTKSDINQYNTEFEILAELSDIPNRLSKSEIKEYGVDIVVDDTKYKIVCPNSHAAAKMYGSSTKWCITTKRPNVFEDYSLVYQIYFVIIKDTSIINSTLKSKYNKLAILIQKTSNKKFVIYDAMDKTLSRYELKKMYSFDFLSMCQKHFMNTTFKKDIIEQTLKLKDLLVYTYFDKQIPIDFENINMVDNILKNLTN